MIDIIDPDGIAIDVQDAVAGIAIDSNPALIGRLIQVLVDKKIISAQDLRRILPLDHAIRE